RCITKARQISLCCISFSIRSIVYNNSFLTFTHSINHSHTHLSPIGFLLLSGYTSPPMGIRNIKIPLKKIAKDAFLQRVPSNCQAYIDEILPQLFRLARNPNWLKPEEERDPHDKSVR